MAESYLTRDGFNQLKSELEQLKTVDRVALAKRLREAIQMGDLSENADYHKAKEDQGFLEGRIQELEYLLSNATVVDVDEVERSTVQVGTRVTVQETGFEPETYFLVGAKEADPRNGKISNESPIGRALMGGKAGDIVVATTPGGSVEMKILKIE